MNPSIPSKRESAVTGKIHEFQLQCEWLKIVLKDDTGKPIPHELYRVLQNNRKPLEGELDDSGFAYIEGLLRGRCTIIFPNIDKADWELPGNPPPVPGLPEPERPWLAPPPPPLPPVEPIWAVLQDDRGNPIAGEAYRLLRGQTILHEGVTDADGRVKELWVVPGPYKILFLNIDKSDWSPPPPPSAGRGLEDLSRPWLAPPVPPGPPPLEPVWAVLRDDGGNPVAGEPYQIVRKGAVLHEGTTDADGRVKEMWIEPGSYSLRFTNIDKADWELPAPGPASPTPDFSPRKDAPE